ncbi:hypothetical protein H0H81_007142 [Sphagnurus paluster]|uniref:Cytochrome P450 n=1 Tax=Sphagnurus paluster TaxID=117069 RepID=A0A9P7GRI9_9AGAR|nr:hypothetical protein H0H81_007142 [Sphagnurus paluster]
MDAVFKRMCSLTRDDLAFIAVPLSIALVFLRLAKFARRPRTTRLPGPTSTSFIFGVTKDISESEDSGVVFEEWEKQYGAVYAIPTMLGAREIVLCDPKAIAHYYAGDTFTFQQPPDSRFLMGHFFGHNVLWAEGETHKRHVEPLQRRSLSPAFSNAAIRELTPVFYDSAYTLKTNWDISLENSTDDQGVVIDVQKWLDSIGAGGFSHDFGSLKGHISPIAAAFHTFNNVKPSPTIIVWFLLTSVFPFLGRLPNEYTTGFVKLRESVRAIADELLERARLEKEANLSEGAADKSIIGSLARSETASSSVHLSLDEIVAQNLFILAGYETTAISLTWPLIELCRHPEKQTKLREELSQFTDTDPTYEQLTNSLPYLDALVSESLRLHPPMSKTKRQAHADNVLPLTHPVHGLDSVFVARGTTVRVPISCINRSEAFWGPDAKMFRPERWLDGSLEGMRAAEVQGVRHLLTFVDGPRTCLGRAFALTEFKAVLSVLIRNFTFELPGGPETPIGRHRGILPRPKVVGEEGPKVPLLIRRVQ